MNWKMPHTNKDMFDRLKPISRYEDASRNSILALNIEPMAKERLLKSIGRKELYDVEPGQGKDTGEERKMEATDEMV